MIFCALPHATTQKVVKAVAGAGAGRPRSSTCRPISGWPPGAYAKWYGHEHHAPELQKEAVYGLTEIYRRDIRKARLVANPGCYTTVRSFRLFR